MDSFYITTNEGTVYKTSTLANGISIAQIIDDKTNALLTKVIDAPMLKEGDVVEIIYSIKGSVNKNGGISGNLTYDIQPKEMQVSTSLILRN